MAVRVLNTHIMRYANASACSVWIEHIPTKQEHPHQHLMAGAGGGEGGRGRSNMHSTQHEEVEKVEEGESE